MLHFDKGEGGVEEEYYKLGEETRLSVPLPSPPHTTWLIKDILFLEFGFSHSTNSFVIAISLSVTEPCRRGCTQVSELRISERTVLFDILVSSLSKPG